MLKINAVLCIPLFVFVQLHGANAGGTTAAVLAKAQDTQAAAQAVAKKEEQTKTVDAAQAASAQAVADPLTERTELEADDPQEMNFFAAQLAAPFAVHAAFNQQVNEFWKKVGFPVTERTELEADDPQEMNFFAAQLAADVQAKNEEARAAAHAAFEASIKGPTPLVPHQQKNTSYVEPRYTQDELLAMRAAQSKVLVKFITGEVTVRIPNAD